MKKYIHHSLLLITGILLLTACYKDKGNYNYTDLDTFQVDTPKTGTGFIIRQFDTLKLKSGLVYHGDHAQLKYSWSAYLYTANTLSGNYADTLSRMEDLAVPVSLLPDKYYLEFTATDPVTGRRASARYTMNVESTGSGLLVLYEKNNQVDCDLIKTKLLEGQLLKDDVIRNLYSRANPERSLTGDAVSINMFKMANVQHISILTSNEGIYVSPADLAITKNFKDLFFIAPTSKSPQGYYAPLATFTNYESSFGFEMMVNDGLLYVNPVLLNGGKESAFALYPAATGSYKAAPYILQGGGRFVVYDQVTKRFLQTSILSNVLSEYTSSVLGSPPFNANNIGKDMVYMAYGYGSSAMAYGIFRNPVEDGKRFVYILDFNTSAARAILDISSSDKIAQARLFALGLRGQLMYYAVDNKIYQQPFDLATGTAQPAVDAWPFIPAGEEVTCIKMCPHPGRNVPENALDKYLMAGTYNKTSGIGKVYLLQVNVTSGVIQTQPAAVYEQFGRIKDISYKF